MDVEFIVRTWVTLAEAIGVFLVDKKILFYYFILVLSTIIILYFTNN